MAFQKKVTGTMTQAFPGDYYRPPVRAFGSNASTDVTVGTGVFVASGDVNYEKVKQTGTNGDAFIGFVVKTNTAILLNILAGATNQYAAGSRLEICAQGALWVVNNVAGSGKAVAKIGYKVAVEKATGLVSVYDPNSTQPADTVATDFVVISLGSDGSLGSLIVIANDQQLSMAGA